MFRIIAKSALSEIPMRDKASKGASFCELQMLGELYHEDATALFKKAQDIDAAGIMDIVAVHSPLLPGKECFIENLEDRDVIEKTCELAQMFADSQGHDVVVVVHAPTHPMLLRQFGALDGVVGYTRGLLEANPGVVLALEIHAPYEYLIRDGHTDMFLSTAGLALENGNVTMSNVELVKLVDHPRCIPLLDTVHMQMFSHWLNSVGEYLYNEDLVEASKTFKRDLIQQVLPGKVHIHFARGIENGYGKGKHGMPFCLGDEDAETEARTLIGELVDGGFDGDFVIETMEDDYTDAKNYPATLELVKMILDEKGVPYIH